MKPPKRLPETDIPRRIYKSTIDRIDKHLNDRPRKMIGKRKAIKGDFNKFLESMLNVYEEVQIAKTHYALKLYADIEEARGVAIMEAAKAKKPLSLPVEVLVIGEVD